MKKGIILSIILVLLLSVIAIGIVYSIAMPLILSTNYTNSTNNWHDVYGYYASYYAKAGDIIIAKDPDGVVCGAYKISGGTMGKYGFMHIYADDSSTAIDEGAKINDTITFYINSMRFPQTLSWKGDREITFLNLTLMAAIKDTDHDSIADDYDLCPNTPINMPVDNNGCSSKQFCEKITNFQTNPNICLLADWKNNEPGLDPQDCMIQGAYCTNTINAN